MIFLPEDREICEGLLESLQEPGGTVRPLSEIVLAVGRRFLGAPYEAGTLERAETEELVVNLRTFDCVTFVECTLALAGGIQQGKTRFMDFAAALERIRYRGGRRRGYPSRLHYFTDWLRDNERKGIVRDITASLGGTPFRKGVCAITDRPSAHPALRETAMLRWMRKIESLCSQRTLHRIAKGDLARAEGRIADGDLLAFTTDRPGLDVGHAGLAVRLPGGLRLLHASSRAGKVVLSEMTLGRDLGSRPDWTGVMVGRPVPKGVIRGLSAKRQERRSG